MDRLKKILHLVGLVVFLIIASVGLGVAPALGQRKEEYLNREIKTEMVDDEEDEITEISIE